MSFKTIKNVLKAKTKKLANRASKEIIPTALGGALSTFHGASGMRDGYIAGKVINHAIKTTYQAHKKKASNNEKV